MKISRSWWSGLVGGLLLVAGCRGGGEGTNADSMGSSAPAAAAPAAPAPVVTTPPVRLAPTGPSAVEGEVIVKLATDSDVSDLALRRLNARGVLQMRRSPLLQQAFERFAVRDARRSFAGVRAPEAQRVFQLAAGSKDVDGLLTTLRATPGVVYAEPNRINHVVYAPNDPYYASSGSWGQPYADLWGAAKVAAPGAWNTTLGAGVTVAVVDTGIDYGHPDIAANVWQNAGEVGADAMGRDKRSNGVDDDGNGYVDDWHGYNFATFDAQPRNEPMDDFGHGTHVAGTIAAVGNNGVGVVGIAPSAKVMAVKALDSNGAGTDVDLASAIYYAAQNGAKIINASWGVLSNTRDQTLIDAVNYVHDNYGVVVVAAAGNNTQDVGNETLPGYAFYPAAAVNAMAVAATTHTDAASSFSNYGAKLDVSAPGGGDTDSGIAWPDRSILSLLSSHATSAMTNNGVWIVGTQYLRQAGTSMAAPHVAGVAALVRALRPTFTADQVRSVLRASADDVQSPSWDILSGYGRVNATAALAITAPLAAHLSGPLAAPNGLGSVAITGTAAGSGFSQYRLEYGIGTNPGAWTVFATSSAQVTNGTLGTLNLAGLADGVYQVHLVATTTAGKAYEDRLSFPLTNFTVERPTSTDDVQVRTGGSLSIMGTITVPGLTNYTATVQGATVGAVSPSVVTLANGGTQPVTHGLLATFNSTGLANDHYTITLTARSSLTSTTVSAIVRVTVDSTLHAGWPWRYDTGVTTPYVGPAEPWYGMTAFDLDGDGAAEVLDMQSNNVYVLRGDGTPFPGWPQPVHTQEGSSFIPLVGDITGDGVPEVIATGGNGEVYVWTRNGVLLPGWPKTFGDWYIAITLADMNHDGVKDLVASNWGRSTLQVLNGQGTPLPGWPVTVSLGFGPGQPAVGDINGDGDPDIVLVAADGTGVTAYRSNGTVMPNWPRTLSGTPLPYPYHHNSTPALADLDGDGKLDVIVGSNDGKMMAWRGDGAAVTGWPKSTVVAEVNAAAVGDIDGDGKLEVVAGASTVFEAGVPVDYLYAWHADGSLLAGWPIRYAPGIVVRNGGFHAPVLADVDGDGKADVVVSSDAAAPANALHAYRFDATEAAGFPKATSGTGVSAMDTPAIADFDGDGLLELLWAAHYNDSNYQLLASQLVMWDLTTAKTAPQPWPVFGHDINKTSAVPASAVPPPTLVALSRTGWTATASSNPAATPVTYALDGSATTRWATGANQVAGQYFQLDLQAPQTFSQIVLDSSGTAGNYPQAYQVFVSNDGVNWGTAVATGSGNTSGLTTITFTQQTARYIKIVQTGTLNHWWSIYEINVFGPPPPPVLTLLPRTGWTATASSNPAATPVTYALDGSATTRWATGANQVAGQYYQVDMQAPQTFAQLVLDSSATAGNYPQAYQVFVSSDGVNWGTAVATGSGNTTGLTTITFTQQTARFIKIVQTGTLNHWWSIYELNVYGVSSGPPAPSALSRTGWVGTASNSASTTANALDGVATTRWTTGTAQTTNAWYQVDMLTNQTFNQLTLDSAGSTNDYPRGYSVFVSTDGVNFGSAIATGSGTSKLVTVTFPSQTARFIKVTLTAGISNWWSIAELNVWH